MGFAFHRDESFAHAVHRLIRQRLDAAVTCLEETPRTDAAVHEARKSLKKTRAVIRLAGAGMNRAGRFDRRLGTVARVLGRSRDSAVLLAAQRELRQELSRAESDRLESSLQHERKEAEAATTMALASLLAELRALRTDLVQKPVRGGWSVAWHGIEDAYRRGSAAHRQAARSGDGEDLHRWRRRVKDQWYHLRLLVGAWPAGLTPLASELEVVSDRLGTDHDLHVLSERAAVLEPDAKRRRALVRTIAPRRSEAQRIALQLGTRLYVEKPSAYAARLRGYWCAWSEDAD